MSLLGFCEGFWAGFAVGLGAGLLTGGRATGWASAAGRVLDGKSTDDAGFPVGATALATADAGAGAGGLVAIAGEAAALATTSGAPAAAAAAGEPANERMPTAPAMPATKSAPTPSAARTPEALRFEGAGVFVVGAPVSELAASELAEETPLVKVTTAGAALNEPLPTAEYGPLPASNPRTARPHTAASDSLNCAAV